MTIPEGIARHKRPAPVPSRVCVGSSSVSPPCSSTIDVAGNCGGRTPRLRRLPPSPLPQLPHPASPGCLRPRIPHLLDIQGLSC